MKVKNIEGLKGSQEELKRTREAPLAVDQVDQVGKVGKLFMFFSRSMGRFPFYLLATFVLCGFQPLFAKVPEPILPLPMSTGDLPLLEKSLRIPSFNQKKFPEKYVTHLKEEIDTLSKKIDKEKTPRKLLWLRDVFENQIAYSYYLSNLLDGTQETKENRLVVQKKIQEVYENLNQTANQIIRMTPVKDEKKTIEAELALINFQNFKTREKSVQILEEITPQLSDAKLTQLTQFALTLDRVISKKSKNKEKDLKDLKALGHQLSREAVTLSQLVKAQAQAETMDKTEKSNDDGDYDYRKTLKLVSSLCKNYTKEQKKDLLSFSLGVWSTAQDFKSNWKKIPFKVECFKNLPSIFAITERVALQEWYEGRFQPAEEKYRFLLKQVEETERSQMIHQRITDLLFLMYQKTGVPDELQKHFADSYQKYQGTLYGIEIKNQYYDLVIAEINKASIKNAPVPHIITAQKMTESFMSCLKNDLKAIEASLALADVLNKQSFYEKAAEQYLKTSEALPADSRSHILLKAVMAQMYAAKWPLHDPWNAKSGEFEQERKKLLEIYLSYREINQEKQNWDIHRQIGNLYLVLGEPAKAYELWEKTIQAHPHGSEALKALSVMLQESWTKKNWLAVETYADMGIKLGINPTVLNMTPLDMYEQALLHASDMSMKDKKFDLAIARLEKLEEIFSRSEKHSAYLYKLAQVYQTKGDFENCLHMLQKLMSQEEKTSFYKDGLLMMADLYIGMAEEDKAIGLFKNFIALFPTDEKFFSVQLRLLDMLIAQSIYDEANHFIASLYKMNLDERQRAEVLRKESELKMSQGESFDSKNIQTIMGNKYLSQDEKIKFYYDASLKAFRKRDKNQLKNFEQNLLSLDLTHNSVAEAVNWVQLLQVKLQADKLTENLSDIVTEDTTKQVSSIKSLFAELKTSHLTICKEAKAPYCLQSLQNLSSLTDKMIQAIQDVVLEKSEGEEAVKEKNKELLLSSLNEEQRQLKDKMLTLEKRDMILPEGTYSKKEDNLGKDPLVGVGFLQLPHKI